MIHEKYYELLKAFNLDPETLAEFSDTLKNLLDQYNEVAIS